MIRHFLVTWFLSVCSLASYAQENDDIYQYTQEDQNFREYRARRTVPPYGLEKVKKLINGLQYEAFEDGDAGMTALPPAQFKSLTFQEQFTYVMIHPETYAQNCSIFVPQPDEQKKIFSYLISWMDESQWSDRQLTFLRENRDSVMTLIRESTLRSKHMGVNYKDAIVEINGWEMIPFLTDYIQNNEKDKDALTVLLLLMKKGAYVPFLKSTSFQKLYGKDYNYESFIYYNAANKELILERAGEYFAKKKKEK